MQAVVLAAGSSSRFWPFNNTHKSLLRIMDKPIIFYTIQELIKATIKNIVIVQGPKRDIEKSLGNYNLGASVKYVVQSEPKGMGNALLKAKDFLDDQFMLLDVARIEAGNYLKLFLEKQQKTGAKLILLGAKTSNPQFYGVFKLEGDIIKEVVEKPEKGKEPSNIKNVVVQFLPKEFIDYLQRVPEKMYSFEDALSLYAKEKNIRMIMLDKEPPSLKYPWHLFDMRDYLFSRYLKENISKRAVIAKSAEIIGDVTIEDNVSIMENVVIKGPCYIGKNAYVGNNSVLRQGVDLGKNSVVGANMEFKNTLMMENSKVHSGFVGDSIIGKNCRIGAGFSTANVRLDRATVKSVVKSQKIDTGLKSLGMMIGDDTHIGIKSSSMPGVIIGRKVTIGSNTSVMENVPDNTKYYTKFQEVIVKK